MKKIYIKPDTRVCEASLKDTICNALSMSDTAAQTDEGVLIMEGNDRGGNDSWDEESLW